MKKSFKKSLMILLSIIMVMTMAMPVAFAEETAAVDITFADADMESTSAGLLVTNLVDIPSDREKVEGYYITDGIIIFNFSEPMNVSTLTPDNIVIKLENADNVKSSNLNTETLVWSYTPSSVPTSTTYSIDIADMCEGVKLHEVEFTNNVETAAGVSISPVTKKFKTGRIAVTSARQGKVLKDVAHGKSVVGEDGLSENYAGFPYTKLTQNHINYSTGESTSVDKNWVKIDLGNYYSIAAVASYIPFEGSKLAANLTNDLEVAYSCDPMATGDEATFLGVLKGDQYCANSDGNYYIDNVGGLGGSSWLQSPEKVRARYIFVRLDADATAKRQFVSSLRVIAALEADYGTITATMEGEEITEFTGAGEYVVSVPATEYKAGSSNNYMIVAGYDANGVVTMINCAPVSSDNGVLSLKTTFTDTTKSLKAVLIKDFTQPQMLTDALILPAPAATQE